MGRIILWVCKHCGEKFDFIKNYDKANHSRWCKSNPKRNDSIDNIKTAKILNFEKKIGPEKEFVVICNNCEEQFTVIERENKFPEKERYYCSEYCARSFSAKVNVQKMEVLGELSPRVLCERNNEKTCIVPGCEFSKILEIHHVDENHENNSKENLIFLCPNHHRMYHSRFKDEILTHITNYISDKWGCDLTGRADTCTV